MFLLLADQVICKFFFAYREFATIFYASIEPCFDLAYKRVSKNYGQRIQMKDP